MKLPETKEEWQTLRDDFLSHYPLQDSPETWTFIISQLQNTKMPELEFDMDIVYAHYKRWKIAKVLQDEKAVYLTQLQDKLEQHLKATRIEDEGASSSGDNMSCGACNIEGDMPTLQETSEGMVPVT